VFETAGPDDGVFEMEVVLEWAILAGFGPNRAWRGDRHGSTRNFNPLAADKRIERRPSGRARPSRVMHLRGCWVTGVELRVTARLTVPRYRRGGWSPPGKQ
jgi:hypothetical protein